MFYKELMDRDKTYHFIEAVQREFSMSDIADQQKESSREAALGEVTGIADEYGITDINLIKPSIGEATRVLLRRMPWKMLVHSLDDKEHLGHLYQLAEEKGCELVEYPLKHYRACGLIKTMADN